MKAYHIAEDKRFLSSAAFLGASADELRVLAFLALAEEPKTAEELAAALKMGEEDLRDVLSFWRGAGAISLAEGEKTSAKPKKKRYIESADTLSDYSDSEAARIIDEGDLSAFVEQCQEIYGKVLSPADIHIVLGLHDQLGFDPEYICLLIAFCNKEGNRKAFRYIEKVALSLYDRGVLSVKELEDYIEKKQMADSREGKIRKMFGIGARALTSKEDAAILRWCEEYGYDDSVIEYAYELTVNATAKPTISYTDRILANWYKAGCHNLLAVKEYAEKQKEERQNAKKTGKKAGKESDQKVNAEKESMRSFDVDDFFERAIARSYGDKNKKES